VVAVLPWLQSLLPQIPEYGYVFVFIVVFLNNISVPLPGETILLGAGFYLGTVAASLWQPMVAGTVACSLGGICSFLMGRRLGHSHLEKVHWLHLSAKKLAWPEQFFNRHGAKAIFIARFIPLFPPVLANLFAGMSKVEWPVYLFYNITGSAAYTATYILIGYFFGKQWEIIEAWLSSETLYLILAGVALIILSVIFRHIFSRKGMFQFFKSRRREYHGSESVGKPPKTH
jgi:membrane protein DedA with SNARE-associated domain